MVVLLVVSVAVVGALWIAVSRVRREGGSTAVVLGLEAPTGTGRRRDTLERARVVDAEKLFPAGRMFGAVAQDPDPTDDGGDPPSGSGSAAAAMVDAPLQPRVYPRRRPDRS